MTPSRRYDVETEAATTDRLGSGRRLDPEQRARLEHALGRRLTEVRVHNDARARRRASDEGAHAFAQGTDIALGPTAPSPGSLAAELLVAHEVTHIAQQRSGAGSLARAAPEALEGEADRSAEAAIRVARERPGAPAGHAAPRRAAHPLELHRCPVSENAAPTAVEEACPEGPATVTIDEAVRAPFGRSAMRLEVEGHTCIPVGTAEVYVYEGDPANCSMNGTTGTPFFVGPVIGGQFDLEIPTMTTMVPGIGRQILVRVVSATDPSVEAIACAEVTAS